MYIRPLYKGLNYYFYDPIKVAISPGFHKPTCHDNSVLISAMIGTECQLHGLAALDFLSH
jgi:hypothetical protein